ncbi:NADH:flavin oxidoreductase/NADH oxidase [Metallibacterium scheffleri]|uniref:Oxidoreductase n=1 Tax=Metallibacterium scheffleri TaxID=993689 RepID=A0A4S3KHZ2_9GAMM|nr:NADH:flavin oxidoreductase/NADH oxidase [Metallibacterium scheffleri]THD07908.1 oxidoreductase [Metallibacterium scheffleri]
MLLFSTFQQRELKLRNRIVVSPMCQYSARDGVPDDWHFVHLSTRAVGGAAVVFTEATAVAPQGRISPADTGIWNDTQQHAWARIAAFISAQGAIPAMQLAHAGRKASTAAPWDGGKGVDDAAGGWQPLAPSARAFRADYRQPRALDDTDIAALVQQFVAAARRADAAGFGLIELHAAHGYLLHQFLSPLSNQRTDRYGGSFDNRIRLLLEVTAAARAAWPAHKPLWVRISASDWVEGGWDIEQSIALCRQLRELGVDLIDVSSGGLDMRQQIEPGPGYQVEFAARIRNEAGIATGAVGMITDAQQAETILATRQADVILLARELLRDPYFPRRAAQALGVTLAPPPQYARAW